LGSGLKLYQDNDEGKIFSVRNPANKPEVTIRIKNNVLQEAKGKQNSSPSVEGAAHAIKWFETIEGLEYHSNSDYQNFPPLSAEEARNKFLQNSYDLYDRGWVSSWYRKGISEIDEDVQNKIAYNDPLVFVLAEKNHKLIKPVVQFWFKDLSKKFNEIVYEKIINSNLHKLYKDLPEIIQFGVSVAYNLPYDFLKNHIKEPWAQEYIPAAAEICAKEDPYNFLYNFRDKPWAKHYIDIAAKNCAKKEPYYFLYYFIDKPWAKEYIPTAAKSYAEKDPQNFLIYFADNPWAKEPREDLDGKSFVQYAKELPQMYIESSYSPRLTKLANVLRSVGLSKEASLVLRIK
jgi:hypothetical protein